jgi:hypothetical protein
MGDPSANPSAECDFQVSHGYGSIASIPTKSYKYYLFWDEHP